MTLSKGWGKMEFRIALLPGDGIHQMCWNKRLRY